MRGAGRRAAAAMSGAPAGHQQPAACRCRIATAVSVAPAGHRRTAASRPPPQSRESYVSGVGRTAAFRLSLESRHSHVSGDGKILAYCRRSPAAAVLQRHPQQGREDASVQRPAARRLQRCGGNVSGTGRHQQPVVRCRKPQCFAAPGPALPQAATARGEF